MSNILLMLALTSTTFSASAEYDEQGRMIAQINSSGQIVTRYEYDHENRIVAMTDAAGHRMTMKYDARGRLVESIDASGGVTRYSYDIGDNITQVVDPRGNATDYQYDGFGQLWQQNSPDTGVTQFEYDASGLQLSSTRNDGTVVRFGYDEAGRMTSMAAGGQTRSYRYDQCEYGKGRLCAHFSPGNETYFGYRPDGQIETRREPISSNGETFNAVTQYGYDDAGRLNSILYPDLTLVSYGYSQDLLASMRVEVYGVTQDIVSDTQYASPTQRKSRLYGNGLHRNYSHDQNGRMTAMSVRRADNVYLSQLSYDYTADDKIERIADTANPGMTQEFGYDPAGRLAQVVRGGVDNRLLWDRNGNQYRFEAGPHYTNYSIEALSNRVVDYDSTWMDARRYEYDLLGNRIGEIASGDTRSYSYDPFNRLRSVSVNGVVTDYTINAQGQRVAKTNSSGTTRFIYAGQNRLLFDYDLDHATWSSYLWFGDDLVGLVRDGQITYVHTDHLGRPELVTDENQAVVWQAYNRAFGRSVAQDSIGGLNIGFPGQHYDHETGLWYNGFRDYDANLGRYLQPDPIGISGGMNLYAYADGNPVSFFDSLGLLSICIDGKEIKDFTRYPAYIEIAANYIRQSDSLENAAFMANNIYSRMNDEYQRTGIWTQSMENHRNAEHYMFTLYWTGRFPVISQASLAVAVPAYSLSKIGLQRPKYSPPSFREFEAGYQGLSDSLSLLPGGNVEFTNGGCGCE
jgi:RHS repeat-associated protein